MNSPQILPLRPAVSHPKVEIVCGGPLISGKEIMALSLGRGLRDAGYDVEFLISTWEGSGEFRKRLIHDNLAWHRLRLGFISATLSWSPIVMTLDQLRYWPSLVMRYRQVVSNRRPDAVIHTNWHHLLLLLPFLGPRDIYWVHETIPLRRRFAKLFKAFESRLGIFVCVSHAVAQSVVALGVLPSRVIVIHNGTELGAALAPPGQRAGLTLGIVGQINWEKGHEVLIDAVHLLIRSGLDLQLRIFGKDNGAYALVLKQKARDLGIEGALDWRGFVRDQSAAFASIDVCVVPSRFADPLPTSAIEAGAFGRPVICSNLGGLPEIVRDGETGIVIEPDRPDLLAASIERLYWGRDLIAKMGEAARARIGAEFSQEAFVRRFIGAMQSLQIPSLGHVAALA